MPYVPKIGDHVCVTYIENRIPISEFYGVVYFVGYDHTEHIVDVSIGVVSQTGEMKSFWYGHKIGEWLGTYLLEEVEITKIEEAG